MRLPWTDRVAFFKVENDGFDLGAQRREIAENDLPKVREELGEYLGRLREGESVLIDSVAEPRVDYTATLGLVAEKEKIAEGGEYNLSGERYRENERSEHSFPLVSLGDGELFCIESGGTPKSRVEEYWDGDVPWATLVDLPPAELVADIRTTKRTISESGLAKSSAKLIPENSVIVSTRATIGRIGINRIPLATNQGFKNIIIKNPSRAMPEYIALTMTKLVPTMNAWASGGTFKEISKSRFCELQIPLPPLEVQREIVAEIEGYQRVIDGARAVIDNYRPQIVVDPEWPMVELGKIADVTSSKRILAKEYVPIGVPFYRTKEIVELSRGGSISLELFISRERFESIRAKFGVPCKGDILVSAVGTIGTSWVVSDKHDFYFKDGNLLWIRNFRNTDPYYLKYYLDSIFSGGVDSIVFGAAYKALTIVRLKEFQIPLPPIETQQAVVAEIEAEQSLVAANRELVERMEGKIRAAIGRVWGEADR